MLSNRDILKKILRRIREASYVEPEDIPNIDLYMDQVTTFMDEHLTNNKRHPGDKALTKTMINNYTKNRLLPPPVKNICYCFCSYIISRICFHFLILKIFLSLLPICIFPTKINRE